MPFVPEWVGDPSVLALILATSTPWRWSSPRIRYDWWSSSEAQILHAVAERWALRLSAAPTNLSATSGSARILRTDLGDRDIGDEDSVIVVDRDNSFGLTLGVPSPLIVANQ